MQISTRLKANVNVHEKQLVGNYAAGLVADGECVYLDDGTSLLPLAEQLLRRRVRIVTNNTMILEMSKRAEAEVFLVGGKYSPHYDLSLIHILSVFMGGCASCAWRRYASIVGKSRPSGSSPTMGER